MRIWLDSEKMRSRQISVDDVISGLTTGNTLVPTGYLDQGAHETNLRVMSEAFTPHDFENIIIPSRAGAPIWSQIKIKDVARVEEGLADVRRISRLNGEPALGLGVIKQRGTNSVAVGRGVKTRIRDLKDTLPAGMGVHPIVDSTIFIEDSTHELLFTLGLSAILTSIVCWLFLGSLSSAFNVVLAIPVSLIGSFIFLHFFGFTINTFTLLALSLSIGIVVDDAIMVLENIVRYSEMGMGRVKASLLGAREITGAAVAATLAILAIFLPVVFMKGIIGKFFFQFGIAMSVAVSLSLLEALTLAPMRCSQFLGHGGGNAVTRVVDQMMNRWVAAYSRLLQWSLGHRWRILMGAVLVFGASLLLVGGLKQEFVPPQDQSRFLVSLQTPMGSSLNFTSDVFKKIEAILKTRPEVENYFVAVGGFQGGLVNQGNMFITLKSKGQRGVQEPFKREPSQIDFMDYCRKTFNQIEGVKRASMIDLSLTGFSASRGFPIQFQVQGPDWNGLASNSLQFMEKLKASGLVSDVDTDYNPNMPESKIIPDRAKAYERGVTISNISNTVSAMVGSLRVGRYSDASGHRDDVRIKLEGAGNGSVKDVTRVYVRNNRGEMVPLSQVVGVEPDASLLTISRYNRERAVTIFGNLAKGKSQKDVMAYIDQLGKELPQGYHVVLSGNSQAYQESFQSLMIALVLGILVAYMVLGAQFNSFVHPFTVLLALPFSISGALIALRLTGMSLNIYSLIGILLLMGIVKKNSILLVDFTNQRREEGKSVQEALLEACPLRLRPILMTSFATVAAAIPAAMAFGPGAETTRPMAVVVIGGVILSTLLTLVVVPCAYSLLARLEGGKYKAELKQALLETSV
jgi:HAE1 family hydrophobic/amphiphilic exporter-1